MTIRKFAANKIKSVSEINSKTHWITLEKGIDAMPGQFVMVWLPNIGEKPFSIAAVSPLSLLVVDVGPFSHALLQLSPGDQVWIRGPLGHGFDIKGERLLLVGGGYGTAPLLSLAKQAKLDKKNVEVCIGAKTSNDLLLLEDFQKIGCRVDVTTEDGTRGTKGLITYLVEKKISQNNYDILFACGPTGLLSILAILCKKNKLNYQLSWEAVIRCGMGLCGSCEVSRKFDFELPAGWLACFDGPVFKKNWN